MRLKSIKIPLTNGKTKILNVKDYKNSNIEMEFQYCKEGIIYLSIRTPRETHIGMMYLEIKRFDGDFQLIMNFMNACRPLRYPSTFPEKLWHKSSLKE